MSDHISRVALVTGASRGIGRAIAIELGRAGHKVAVNYRGSAEAAAEVVREIEGSGGRAAAIMADVSTREGAEALIESTERELGGPVEILVCNAGITRDDLLMRMKEEAWLDVISTNLSSVYYCAHGVIRSMLRARWGRIVCVSSIVALTGNAGQTNYAAAKAGIIGFVRSLARESASRGVTVNAVAPGFIDTDMTAKLTDEQKEMIIKNVPTGTMGTPEDISRAVAFLVSEGSSYITGQVLAVDGGASAH